MGIASIFCELTSKQRHAFTASLARWALDAFDFFLFVFAVSAIAKEFHATVTAVAEGIFWTLAMRPVGALLFGYLAERYGRRPILMVNVVSYSLCELASAAAPNLTVLLVLRAVFGLAMGGEWGVGAALALETLPAKNRGFFSGLLQEGYVLGYLLASLVYRFLFGAIGWRGMFVVGAAPALLVFYVRRAVHESPAWSAGAAARSASFGEVFSAVAKNLGDLRVSRGADGLLQRAQPRLAGPLPDLPSAAEGVRRRDHGDHRDRVQRGGAGRRDVLRAAVGTDRPPPGHRARRRAGAAGDSAVGLLDDRRGLRGGRLRDAVRGARRVGRRARPPQ